MPNFKDFHIMIDKQSNHKIKFFQFDYVGSMWLWKIILSHMRYNIKSLVFTSMNKMELPKERLDILTIVDNSLSLLAHCGVLLIFGTMLF